MEILAEIEIVKRSLTSGFKQDLDWEQFSKLLSGYRSLIIKNLKEALEKKVDQEIWNQIFKRIITSYHESLKNIKQKDESLHVIAKLSLFLDTAFGFYIMLLQEMCLTYDIEYPFFRASSAYGLLESLEENIHVNISDTINENIKSIHCYMAQHCLIHLGDISRYKGHLAQASSFYITAYRLSPESGHPFNQLAIVEALKKGDNLNCVYYYIRALGAQQPFNLASVNLSKLYNKIMQDYPNLILTQKQADYKCGYTSKFFINTLLTIIASTNLEHKNAVPESVITTFVETFRDNFSQHLYKGEVSPSQLVKIFVITTYTYNRATYRGEGVSAREDGEPIHFATKIIALVFEAVVSTIRLMQKPEDEIFNANFLPYLYLFLKWVSSAEGSRLLGHNEQEILDDKAWDSLATIARWLKVGQHGTALQMGAGVYDLLATARTAHENLLDRCELPEEIELSGFLPYTQSPPEISDRDRNKALANGLEPRIRRDRIINLILELATSRGRKFTLDFPADKMVDSDSNATVEICPEENEELKRAAKQQFQEKVKAKTDIYHAHKLMPTIDLFSTVAKAQQVEPVTLAPKADRQPQVKEVGYKASTNHREGRNGFVKGTKPRQPQENGYKKSTDFNSFGFDFYEAFLSNQTNKEKENGHLRAKEFFDFDNHVALAKAHDSKAASTDTGSYSLFNSKWNLDFKFSLDQGNKPTHANPGRSQTPAAIHSPAELAPGYCKGDRAFTPNGFVDPWKPKPYELGEYHHTEKRGSPLTNGLGQYMGTWSGQAGAPFASTNGKSSYTSV